MSAVKDPTIGAVMKAELASKIWVPFLPVPTAPAGSASQDASFLPFLLRSLHQSSTTTSLILEDRPLSCLERPESRTTGGAAAAEAGSAAVGVAFLREPPTNDGPTGTPRIDEWDQ